MLISRIEKSGVTDTVILVSGYLLYYHKAGRMNLILQDCPRGFGFDEEEENRIGRGAFGIVYKTTAVDTYGGVKAGQTVAVKVIEIMRPNRGPIDRQQYCEWRGKWERALCEVEVMDTIGKRERHLNIVRYYFSWIGADDGDYVSADDYE